MANHGFATLAWLPVTVVTLVVGICVWHFRLLTGVFDPGRLPDVSFTLPLLMCKKRCTFKKSVARLGRNVLV